MHAPYNSSKLRAACRIQPLTDKQQKLVFCLAETSPPPRSINSVQTRCIAKTSGFIRGVCKNRRFIKFEGFLVELLENRRS